jgi:signal transduction histidine kinase
LKFQPWRSAKALKIEVKAVIQKDGEALHSDIAAVASIDAIPTMLEVVCHSTGMGFAAVARVTADRWIACSVRDEIDFGVVPGGELKVETTICDEIRNRGNAVVIDNVAEDALYCSHATPAMYGFQSYISMPIFRRGGEFFGTLCAIDPHPAQLNRPQIIGMFRLFADLIGFHLDAQERLARTEASLTEERKSSELREQFIAVLGHDLRNPLSAISSGAELLRRVPPDKAPSILTLIDRSVLRMSKLIDNVLDFARGRLGGGLALELTDSERLEPALEQVIAELRTTWPERTIDARFELNSPIRCDRPRVAQLLSNLAANAITHGAADRPITIRASDLRGVFQLSVANHGDQIDQEAIALLFQPFFREAGRSAQQGLGLGLYIVSEIARAHGGTMNVVSTLDETRFTFQMPLDRRLQTIREDL